MKTFRELINELNPGEMEFSRARRRETSSRHKTSETREKAFVGLFRRVTGKSPTPSQIRNSGAKEGGAKYDETNRELRRKLILTKKINKGYENMRRGKKNPEPYPYGKMADREAEKGSQ